MGTDWLFNLLTSQRFIERGYVWESYVMDGDDPGILQRAAQVMAEFIVEEKCPATVAAIWRRTRNSGGVVTDSERRNLLANLKETFGSPDKPRPDDHVQGAIAEYLWLVVMQNRNEPREVVRIEKPSFSVTDPGGDGLVVYRDSNGTLIFRLWEIKKHTSTGTPLHDKARAAYSQLTEQALSYLARYSTVRQVLESSDPELAQLYARLVDLWDEQAPEVGAGVSIATSHSGDLDNCFTDFPSHFPDFALTGERLEALLQGISDYARFCAAVKEAAWIVL